MRAAERAAAHARECRKIMRCIRQKSRRGAAPRCRAAFSRGGTARAAGRRLLRREESRRMSEAASAEATEKEVLSGAHMSAMRRRRAISRS